MPSRNNIARAVGLVSFADVMTELTINRPDRMISPVEHESRVRIQSLELIIASYGPEHLVELLSPWRTPDNNPQIEAFVSALRLCVNRRHPDWMIAPSALLNRSG